jgi:hypothetical protein
MGVLLGSVGAVVLAGVVAGSLILRAGSTRVDKSSGCPVTGYDSVTVVLVDLTDPVNPVQAAALRNALTDIRNAVPKYGRLEVYPLEPTTAHVIEPLFAACSPGNAKNVASDIYGNRELADRLWHKKFANRLDAVVDQIRKLPDADNSPLFEGIQSVAVTAFGAPPAEHAKEKRLIVISDMLHNTHDLSMYGTVPAFEVFKVTPYHSRIRPSLRDVNVDIYIIARETRHNVQQPPLYTFWVEYFEDAGGYLRNWKPLQ